MKKMIFTLLITLTVCIYKHSVLASEKFSGLASASYNHLTMDVAEQSSNSGFSLNPRLYFPVFNPTSQISFLIGGGLSYEMFLKSGKSLGMDSFFLGPSFGIELTNIANFILTILVDYQYALFNNVTQSSVSNDEINIKNNQKFGFDIVFAFEAMRSLFLGCNMGLHFQSINLKKSGKESSNTGSNASVGLSIIYAL